MKHITLEVVGGDVGSDEISLPLPATIGRGRDASISLTHPLVSRRHCEIVFSQGRVLVRDLDSLNGTFVGSDRVAESVLRSGDLLTIGTVTFRAVYDESAPRRPHSISESPSGGNGSNGTTGISGADHDTFRVPNPSKVDRSQTNDTKSHPSCAESDA